jgi:hypothetical protein
MLAQQLGPMEIAMYADVSRLARDMQEAKSVVKGAADFMGGAFAALGVTLSAAAFGKWIKGAVDAADEASKMAQKLGVTTDKLAGMQLAFEQSGAGGADTMQRAMVRLSDQLIAGNKSLEALGIVTKDSREALGLLADKFAGMADGTAKTAAAVDVFGTKLGANMIPLLNAGGQGLREMDELARKLGLTLDTETGKRAELFNDTLDSIGQVSHGVATQVASQLLPTMNALAGAMLDTATEGERVRSMADVVAAGLKGLFSVAAVGVEVFNTLGKVAGAQLGVWDRVFSGDFRGALEVMRAAREDIGEGWIDTASMIRKAWDGSASSVAEKSAEMAKQQRLAAQAAADLEKKLLAQSDAAKKAAAEAKKLADAEADRLSRRGLADLRRQDEAELEAERATLARIKAEQDWLSQRGLQEMQRYDAAEQAAEERYAKEVESAKKAQEQITGQWQKGVDQMAQSFTDALMTGGQNVADYLRDLFRTLVLRPVLLPAGTAAAAFASGPASASGGGMGGISGIGSLLGGLGTFGSAAGAGVSATLGGAGLGGLLSGAGSMLGQGTMAGISGGLGLGLGAIAPYALGALALYSLGKKLFSKTLDDTGITGTFSGSGFSGQSFAQYSRIIGGDSTSRKALSSELDAVFDAGALAARESVKAYADALGLPVKAIEGITQKIKFSTKGQSAEETAAEIERFVGKYAETLASAYAPALKQFQKVGESVGDTLQRLAGLQTFSDTMADLGGVFQRVAGLSVDAREGFIAMAGGMDALGQKAMAFVQEYYNRDEIAGIKAAEIKQALEAVGITQDVNSRDDFRKLVDGLDVSTQRGQEQLAALLDMASGFTQVADYIAEIGGTLSGVAGQSPSTGAAAALFGPGGQGEQQIMAINNVSYWTELVYNAVKELTGVVAGGSSAQTGSTRRTVEVNVGWTPEYSTGGI